MEENYKEECDCCCPAQILADMLATKIDKESTEDKSVMEEINHLSKTRVEQRDRADNWQACAIDLSDQLTDRKEHIDWTYKKMHALERELDSLKDESNRRLHLIEKQRDEITELKELVAGWKSTSCKLFDRLKLSADQTKRVNDVANLSAEWSAKKVVGLEVVAKKWESTARHLSTQLSARHDDMTNLLERFHDSEEKLSSSEYEVRALTAQLYLAEDKAAKCSKELAKFVQRSSPPQFVCVPGRNATNCGNDTVDIATSNSPRAIRLPDFLKE